MVLESVPSRDVEFAELERHDMLTGDRRSIDDEKRNAQLSLALGGAAALFCLIAMILTWVLYYRERRRTFLWHAIWLIFAFLFGAVCAVWALGASSSLAGTKQPSPILSLVVFLFALFFMGLLLVQTQWLIFYYNVHHDYLVGLKTNQDVWNKRMVRDSIFENGWKSSRRLMTWTILFTLLSAGCFAFIAYAARSVVLNRYLLTRFGLYWALFWVSLSSWILIYWCEEAFEYESFIDSPSAKSEVRTLKVLAILALIFAFLNAIVNFLRAKLGYFLFAIIGLLLLVIFVCTTGLLWRDIREKQQKEQEEGTQSNCAVTMTTIHESNYEGLCPMNAGKYLSDGQTCSKKYLATKWEANSQPVFLNPACCASAKFFYIKPYMQCAYWATAIFIALAVAVAFNFYLGDTSDYLTNINKTVTIGDILGLVGIVIAAIAFILYFIFRKANYIPNGSRNAVINSFKDPDFSKVDGWDPVPKGVVDANSKTPSFSQTNDAKVCFKYDTKTSPFPTFQTTGTDCTDKDLCVIRIALATFEGATFQPSPDVKISTSNTDSRYFFFPNCNTMSSFLNVWGTEKQIQDYLSALQVCPGSISTLPLVQYYKDQVKSQDIYSSGLKTGEVSTGAADNTNTPLCESGFSNSTCNTDASCKWRNRLTSQVSFRTLKGRFYYIQDGQKKYTIPTSVSVAAQDNVGSVGINNTILDDGTFFIKNIPKYNSSLYKIKLVIQDSKSIFLTKNVDVVVDPITTEDISAGEIRLLTTNGAVCPDDANLVKCVADKKTPLKGRIMVATDDASSAAVEASNKRIGGVSVRALKDHIASGAEAAKGETDTNGLYTFENLDYGAYTVAATKTGYNPSIQLIDLQEQTNSPKAFVMNPTSGDYDMKVVAEMVSIETDYDLHVEMESDKGKTCTVSPYNKYCPYSAHVSDLVKGPGEEQVILKKLAVANYNSYVTASPDYSTTCAAGDDVAKNSAHYSSIKWAKHSESSKKISFGEIIYRFLFSSFSSRATGQASTQTQTDSTSTTIIQNLYIRFFPRTAQIETQEQAKKSRKILNFNGEANTNEKFGTSNTDFLEADRKTDANKLSVETPVSDLYLNEAQRLLPNNLEGKVIDFKASTSNSTKDGATTMYADKNYTQILSESTTYAVSYATVVKGASPDFVNSSSANFNRNRTINNGSFWNATQLDTTEYSKATDKKDTKINEVLTIPVKTGVRSGKVTKDIVNSYLNEKSEPSATVAPKSNTTRITTITTDLSDSDGSKKFLNTSVFTFESILYRDYLFKDSTFKNSTKEILKETTSGPETGDTSSLYKEFSDVIGRLPVGLETTHIDKFENNTNTTLLNQSIVNESSKSINTSLTPETESPAAPVILHELTRTINDTSSKVSVSTKDFITFRDSSVKSRKVYNTSAPYFFESLVTNQTDIKGLEDGSSSGTSTLKILETTNNTKIDARDQSNATTITCTKAGSCKETLKSTLKMTGPATATLSYDTETTYVQGQVGRIVSATYKSSIIDSTQATNDVSNVSKVELVSNGDFKVSFNKSDIVKSTEYNSYIYTDYNEFTPKTLKSVTSVLYSSSKDNRRTLKDVMSTVNQTELTDSSKTYDAAGVLTAQNTNTQTLFLSKFDELKGTDKNSDKKKINVVVLKADKESYVSDYAYEKLEYNPTTAPAGVTASLFETSDLTITHSWPTANGTYNLVKCLTSMIVRNYDYYNKTTIRYTKETKDCETKDATNKYQFVNENYEEKLNGASQPGTFTLVQIKDVTAGTFIKNDRTPPAAAGRRRILMEIKPVHKNEKKVVRKPAHKAAATNFQWISCFTGFGESSVVYINLIQDAKPTMDQCKQKIKEQKSSYTVEELRKQVDSWNQKNN